MNDYSSEELFNAGIRSVDENRYDHALSCIRLALEKEGYESVEEIPPRYLSYLGLLTALAEKRYRKGAIICEKAVKKEFYNPLFHLNLGKVYVAGNYKHKAIKAFYNGLRLDKHHREIITELKKMGFRRKPVISFLTRTHFLNKYLGLLLNIRSRVLSTV